MICRNLRTMSQRLILGIFVSILILVGASSTVYAFVLSSRLNTAFANLVEVNNELQAAQNRDPNLKVHLMLFRGKRKHYPQSSKINKQR